MCLVGWEEAETMGRPGSLSLFLWILGSWTLYRIAQDVSGEGEDSYTFLLRFRYRLKAKRRADNRRIISKRVIVASYFYAIR